MTAPTSTITADKLHADVTAAIDAWTAEYAFEYETGGCKLEIAFDGFDMHIEHISVPADQRQTGLGAAMLSAVTAWADREGYRLRLHASVEYGTDLHVLIGWYGRHGFVSTGRRLGDMAR